MGKVVVYMSVTLDGFTAGLNDGVGRPLGEGGEVLHRWLFAGDRPSRYSDFFRLSATNRRVLDESFETTGALVVGRRTFDVVEGWGGNHPLAGVPVFVLTHRPPANVPRGHTPFTFVTDGIEAAIALARAAAAEKNVGVAGACTARQAMRAGLVDELALHLVPVLLGRGIRLFEAMGEVPLTLEPTRVVAGEGVTHLWYRFRP